MKVILFHEAICPAGTTWAQRMKEVVDEAVHAEACGFDGYAMSEQHLASAEAITSAPDLVLPSVAARPTELRLRVASVDALRYAPPRRIVEQRASLDLVSGAGAEMGGARANSPYAHGALGGDARRPRE